MLKKKVLLSLFTGLSFAAFGQQSVTDSLVSLFHKQLYVFPQEKIYLHTDKPFYITGEKIWFRAHLADASTHLPCPVSQYVYVELFNPLDSLITRVRIRKDNDAYHGYLDIPEDIPEGDYTMRAYTGFMLNLDEHYLCTKTVRIGNPDNRLLQVDTEFSFDGDGTANVDFSFISSYDAKPYVPGDVRMSINGGNVLTLAVDGDGMTGVSFRIPDGVSKRILLLEAKVSAYEYREFIHIPSPDSDFDVTFYPEGGSLLHGVPCRVAFKALKSNGQPASVEGDVFDNSGNRTGQIKTDFMGMGSFTIVPAAGTSYHAVCTIDTLSSKRFELPPAPETGYALSVTQLKEQIYVKILKSVPEEHQDTLYLLAHTRGMVHFASPCDTERTVFNLPKKQFPSGVLHLILFDAGLNPVSERLVFVNNDDQAQVSFDSKNPAARLLVNSRVTVTGDDGQPLTGNFSVSVTADNAVTTDSTTGILTHLLLASDLRGNIANPTAYFRKDNNSAWALDLLMLTQGWRRYDIASVAQGRLARPTEALELGPVISGRVKRLFIDKPVEKSQVSIASANNAYFDLAETDSEGRFSFNIGEQPDSTKFIVQAVPKSGNRKLALTVDGETFTERHLPLIVPEEINKERLEQYMEKGNPKARYKENIRMLELPEVTVTARKPVPKSVFRASYVMDEEWINEINKNRGMISLLEKLPKTEILRDATIIFDPETGAGFEVPRKKEDFGEVTGIVLYQGMPFRRLIIDDGTDTPLTFEKSIFEVMKNIDAEHVTQLYVSLISGGGMGSMFHSGYFHQVPLGMPPVADLIIICKDMNKIFFEKENADFKIIQPLGYQQPAEFYSPKYDTPESRQNQTPDLRTTIHWQPVVQTNDAGEASFEFYTADEATSYSVVIEGLANNGKIIHQKVKLWRED